MEIPLGVLISGGLGILTFIASIYAGRIASAKGQGATETTIANLASEFAKFTLVVNERLDNAGREAIRIGELHTEALRRDIEKVDKTLNEFRIEQREYTKHIYERLESAHAQINKLEGRAEAANGKAKA